MKARNTLLALLTLFLLVAYRPAARSAGAETKDAPKIEKQTSHRFLCADNRKKRVAIVSAQGEIEWEYDAPGCQDAWRLANGDILLTHAGGVKEVTPEKKTVWEYKIEKPAEMHSCQPLPGGLTLVGECAAQPRLLELDREGKIQKEILLELKAGNIHGQMRLCRKTRRGTYLIACTGEGVARELDAEGKVIRNIAVGGNPYVALLLPNDNVLVACGDGHELVEVDPNGRVVWRLTENELPGNPLRFVAGLQRLPNGNTVVSNWGGHGYVGQQPQIFEVTREKKVVWTVFDNERLSTISSAHILDVEGDPAKGEILR